MLRTQLNQLRARKHGENRKWSRATLKQPDTGTLFHTQT
jgi:hypothetical protein